MAGPVGGDYTSGVSGSGANYSPAVQQFFADLQKFKEYMSHFPSTNTSAYDFFSLFTSNASIWANANPNATQAQVQNYLNQFFSGGGDFYQQFYNPSQDWSNSRANFNDNFLVILGRIMSNFTIPIPPMSNVDEMIFNILQDMGYAPSGSDLQRLYRDLANVLFSKGPIDAGTFLNTVLPWMENVIAGGFANYGGLNNTQKLEFIQNFYSNYIGILKDWNNPNAAAFIQELEALFAAYPNGLSAAEAQLINMMIGTIISQPSNSTNFLAIIQEEYFNQDVYFEFFGIDPDFINKLTQLGFTFQPPTAFDIILFEVLAWLNSCPPGSIDRQLANDVLSEMKNLGASGTPAELRQWALDFVKNPQNSWLWNASGDALTEFGELTGVLMTAKQYQSEMATWLKDHKAEKGTPLYDFVKWIETLIQTFQAQSPNGNIPSMEKFLNQYLTSDIYKMFPGLTFAQVNAFYGADMPPGMQPPNPPV